MMLVVAAFRVTLASTLRSTPAEALKKLQQYIYSPLKLCMPVQRRARGIRPI